MSEHQGRAVDADRAFAALLVIALLALALPAALAARVVPMALMALGGAHHLSWGAGLLGPGCAWLIETLPGGPVALALAATGLLAASLVASISMAMRQWRSERRLTAAIEASRRPPPRALQRRLYRLGLQGQVDVIAAARPVAFTYGWCAPRICLSQALLQLLAPDALEAVLRHERHHLRRRDPLRLAIVRALAAGAFVVPALRDVHAHSLTLLELAADAAAMAPPHGRGPLARALYAFVRSGRDSGVPAMGRAASTGGPSLWTLLGGVDGTIAFGPQPRAVLDARIDHLLDPARRPPMLWSPVRLAATAGVLAAALCLLLLL